MNNEKSMRLDLQLSAEDTSQEELDALTRQLLSELRDLNLESAELGSGGSAPAGTKTADPVTIGAIAILVLPTLLPKVVDFIQAWALRGQGRTIKFKGKVAGQAIDFEGSADDLNKLIATLSRSKTPK